MIKFKKNVNDIDDIVKFKNKFLFFFDEIKYRKIICVLSSKSFEYML